MPAYSYPGGELELFAKAVHWKSYLTERLGPHVRGRVLEVGAGVGGMTRFLQPGRSGEWVCLEPDRAQAETISRRIAAAELSAGCRVVVGTLAAIDPAERFDSILYTDVLEHIPEDGAEVRRAAALLAPGGSLVVVAPAHAFLYSAMDAAIGHCRRYSRASLEALRPPALRGVVCEYLDSVGLLASLANRLLLHSPEISARQLALWDRTLVPMSRRLDRLLGGRVGKSVLAVWSAPSAG